MFVNELDSPVDATYRFPTDPDENTVVSRLIFELGEKTVEAKIMAKERAQERYDDALAGGHAAVMV